MHLRWKAFGHPSQHTKSPPAEHTSHSPDHRSAPLSVTAAPPPPLLQARTCVQAAQNHLCRGIASNGGLTQRRWKAATQPSQHSSSPNWPHFVHRSSQSSTTLPSSRFQGPPGQGEGEGEVEGLGEDWLG